MNGRPLTLTEADNQAILLGDSNYINNKGANLYCSETYQDAVAYYQLAAPCSPILLWHTSS